MNYLDKLKTTKTATQGTDKTDKSPSVSNVSTPDRHIQEKKPDGPLKTLAKKQLWRTRNPRAYRVVVDACHGLDITPDQFLALCNTDDILLIASGNFDAPFLRGYAVSFAEGIRTGRVAFHPTSGVLVRHGVAIKDHE